MTNTTMLVTFIDNSGFKRSHIAKKLGITSYTLARKIENKSEFKANEIEILCNLLSIDKEERMAIFFAN